MTIEMGSERKPQHVHLIGICGTAMASLAGMLKQAGMRVTGSDAAAYPPMSDFLAALAIPVAQPFSENNLRPHPDQEPVLGGSHHGRSRPGRRRQRHLARQSRAGIRSGSTHPHALFAGNGAGLFFTHPRTDRHRRDPRQDYNNLDAGLDLPGSRPGAFIFDRGHR